MSNRMARIAVVSLESSLKAANRVVADNVLYGDEWRIQRIKSSLLPANIRGGVHFGVYIIYIGANKLQIILSVNVGKWKYQGITVG